MKEYENGINMTYAFPTENGYECVQCKNLIVADTKRCPYCDRIVVSKKIYEESIESGFTIMILPAKS